MIQLLYDAHRWDRYRTAWSEEILQKYKWRNGALPDGNISKYVGFQRSQSGSKQLLCAYGKHFIIFAFIVCVRWRMISTQMNVDHSRTQRMSYIKHQQKDFPVCSTGSVSTMLLTDELIGTKSEYISLVCLWIQSNISVSFNSSFTWKPKLKVWLQSPWKTSFNSGCIGFHTLLGLTFSPLDL